MTALTDVRTVHSRAYTAWKELKHRKDVVMRGVDAWMDERYERFEGHRIQAIQSGSRWVPAYKDRESFRDSFPKWTYDDQGMMDNLEKVVLMLDKYAKPNKRMKP